MLEILLNLPDYWAQALIAWGSLEGAARATVVHAKVPWLPKGVRAITLFPFVLYTAEAYGNKAVVAHEEVHVAQVRRMGPTLFYAVYLFYLLGGKRNRNHPLEKPAYAVQDSYPRHRG